MTTDKQELIQALNVMLAATRLAPMNYQDHATINRAYETVLKALNPPVPVALSQADEEAARV